MAREPFMPLFFGDFLASTSLWAGEEQALYLLLLAHQWSSGPLPTDIADLALAVRYDVKRFTKLWGKVGQKFQPIPAGLVNPRLEEHRAKTLDISAKNAIAGRSGAAARWRKDGERHQSANSEPLAQRHQSANSSIPSYPIPEEEHPVEDLSRDPCAPPQSGRQRARASDPMSEFTRVKAAYPPFSGNQADWLLAEKACLQRIEEGVSWRELEAAAARFASFVATGGRSGPQYVDLPSKFFGNGLWKQPWDPPASKAEQRLNANVTAAEEAGRRIFGDPK